MMRRLLPAALLLISQLAHSAGPQVARPALTPPGRFKILSGNGRVRIPFEMFRNKIRMTASVNGRPCRLTIDNGALWDELLFFGSPAVDALGFSYSGETAIGDEKDPDPARADRASGVTVRFKDVEFTDQTAVVTRYDPKLPNLWEGLEGQVSATFFKHFVVRLDFDASVIELIRPEEYNPPEEAQVLTMTSGPHDTRTVRATVVTENGLETTLDVLVDIGGIFPLYLPLGKYDSIELPKNAVESSLGAGLAQQKGYTGRVRSVRLGRYTLNDIATAFTPVTKDAGPFGNTMIGMPLLRRFSVTFDYPHGQMVLEPSRSFTAPQDPGPRTRRTALPVPNEQKSHAPAAIAEAKR